ncbi:hypothetical protein [Streptomyces sp. ID05-18]|uniref:hypothetical protein n=1 Tax=Streptomyces sp. ID05-18 TaxID=3028662 RepID=UPI0029BB3B89|nr:hypothetical protein [Streptomyces sp. ID05-18]MDX3488195.1 hypothetical protein [Streptomyces sp. ID05-18]
MIYFPHRTKSPVLGAGLEMHGPFDVHQPDDEMNKPPQTDVHVTVGPAAQDGREQ